MALSILFLVRLKFVKFVKENSWLDAEALAETIESGPLCITDLFQNKSIAYF